MPLQFTHERLAVWQKAAALYRLSRLLVEGLHWRDRHLSDQLLRAVASISLNIAEGISAGHPAERCRFLRFALRSAAEAAAALHLLTDSDLVDPAQAVEIRRELYQVIAMLEQLIRRIQAEATRQP